MMCFEAGVVTFLDLIFCLLCVFITSSSGADFFFCVCKCWLLEGWIA